MRLNFSGGESNTILTQIISCSSLCSLIKLSFCWLDERLVCRGFVLRHVSTRRCNAAVDLMTERTAGNQSEDAGKEPRRDRQTDRTTDLRLLQLLSFLFDFQKNKDLIPTDWTHISDVWCWNKRRLLWLYSNKIKMKRPQRLSWETQEISWPVNKVTRELKLSHWMLFALVLNCSGSSDWAN